MHVFGVPLHSRRLHNQAWPEFGDGFLALDVAVRFRIRVEVSFRFRVCGLGTFKVQALETSEFRA